MQIKFGAYLLSEYETFLSQVILFLSSTKLQAINHKGV